MNSRLANWIASHPKALMDYKIQGKLPRMLRPESPLISLLESIHPRDRQRIRGIRLSPELGYQTGQQFHNAEQLYRWLKPQAEMIEGEPFPAEAFRIKRFSKRLTLADLKDNCAKWLD
ncbi:hypothetical protein [Marinobacter salicampi]|uniref:hypothetical protein n=1 Tax=Marinobacter salicampi TaxID=435907 RepID=UPI001409C67F|nr:hypothetical protein [Marinobacter salicampi]